MIDFDKMIQTKEDVVTVVTQDREDVVAKINANQHKKLQTQATNNNQEAKPFNPTAPSFDNEGLSKKSREDSVFTTDNGSFADELISRLEAYDDFQFEGYAEPEDATTQLSSDEKKTSRWTFNGAEIELDQLTLVYAERRCKQYLDNISANSKKANNPIRTFYSDLIMLNLLTNRILKKIKPEDMEKALNPIKYRRSDKK